MPDALSRQSYYCDRNRDPIELHDLSLSLSSDGRDQLAQDCNDDPRLLAPSTRIVWKGRSLMDTRSRTFSSTFLDADPPPWPSLELLPFASPSCTTPTTLLLIRLSEDLPQCAPVCVMASHFQGHLVICIHSLPSAPVAKIILSADPKRSKMTQAFIQARARQSEPGRS